jgi:putative transcriptional regulator
LRLISVNSEILQHHKRLTIDYIAWYTVGINSMPRPLLVTQQPQIGQLVRQLRQQLNLSQEKFAAHLGVSFQAVSRWENGHTNPSPMALQKLEQQLKKLGDRGKALLAQDTSPHA